MFPGASTRSTCSKPGKASSSAKSSACISACGTITCATCAAISRRASRSWGLWRAFCYWLQKTQTPDDMQDIPPSELAWSYIRQTEQWVLVEHAPQYGSPRRRARDDGRAKAPTRSSCRRPRATRSAAPTRASGCGKRGGRVIRISPSSTPIAIRSSARARPMPRRMRARSRASFRTPTPIPWSSCTNDRTANRRNRAARSQRARPTSPRSPRIRTRSTRRDAITEFSFAAICGVRRPRRSARVSSNWIALKAIPNQAE